MALRLLAAVLAAAVLVTLRAIGSGGTVSAHEHRAVGNYEFTVGWLNEPALANEPNALSLRIVFFENGVPEEGEEADGEEEGVPVEGAEETVRAEIIVGGGAETRALTLEPAFRDPGHYEGLVIPTLPGEYTFHIFGEIDGFEFDETFDSGPETFDSVADPAELQFPESDQGTSNPSQPSGDSDDGDDAALVIAIVAVVLAVAAGGVAVYALRGRMR